MYSKQELIKQLKALNAPQNSLVTVHTSLRAVGETEGRGEGVLEALIEYFTADGGILTVPTHTWKNLARASKQEPTLEESSSETSIGTLPSIAAVHPMARRSLHPTHSQAVFGKERDAVDAIARRDDAATTSTDPKGIYGALYEQNGYVLLLGVGHESNTYLHCVEELLNVPGRLTDYFVPTRVRLKDNSVILHPIRHHLGHPSFHYPKLEAAFRYHGAIKYGQFGNAKVQLCNCRKMYETVKLIYSRSSGIELMNDDEPLNESLYK